MPHDAIATCPICSGELAVTRLHCGSCGTTLEGEFTVGRFARLPREQFSLLESFLRSRGNLKDLERELGVSYPTVRARIDQLLRVLGLADGPAAEADAAGAPEAQGAASPAPTVFDAGTVAFDQAAARRAVLERLSRHEIDAATAAAELRSLGG